MLMRRFWWIGAVLLAVVAAVVVVVWPRGGALPPPRARQYRDVNACLLTGARGLADAQAGAVWAGMEDASLATRVRVSYLAVPDPQTVANALPYAAALVQRQCRAVVAVGETEVAAAQASSARFPAVSFVLVGGRSGGSNVSIVTAGTASVRPDIARLVRKLVAEAK